MPPASCVWEHLWVWPDDGRWLFRTRKETHHQLFLQPYKSLQLQQRKHDLPEQDSNVSSLLKFLCKLALYIVKKADAIILRMFDNSIITRILQNECCTLIEHQELRRRRSLLYSFETELILNAILGIYVGSLHPHLEGTLVFCVNRSSSIGGNKNIYIRVQTFSCRKIRTPD